MNVWAGCCTANTSGIRGFYTIFVKGSAVKWYSDTMRIVLPIVAFFSGAVVMTMELAASRIVAPYLGTSVIVWTSLIGVILAALSLGYWAGGKLADRFPSPVTLAIVLAGASVAIACASYFQWILRIIATFSDLQSAAVIGVFSLFGPATFLLGMVTPLAVKLLLTDIARSGRTVGNLYAISNTGSIVGTFLGGFVLISFFGSSKILAILSLTMLALALLVSLTQRFRRVILPCALVGAFGASGLLMESGISLPSDATLIADVDTTYSRTWIYETNAESNVRVMTNAYGASQSAQYVDDPFSLVHGYTIFFDVFQAFVPKAEAALMIGGSAYTYPRHFLRVNPESTMTVVEIDPEVTELAQRYFGLTDDPRLSIVHADGRVFLNKNSKEYDVVFVDAFSSNLTIPYHLTTKEAVEALSKSLSDNGIVMVNIIASLEGVRSAFLAAEYATYASIFPSVTLYRIHETNEEEYQNVMLVAAKKPLTPESSHPFTPILVALEWHEPLASLPVLLDDFAPVEKYTALLL
jgi:spermidine synthase